MLTNQYGQKFSKRVKQSFFLTQMSLSGDSIQLPFIVHAILIILAFILNMSIFFINSPLQPQVFNQSFQFFLFPSLASRIDISIKIFKIVLIINALVFITLYLIHLRSNFMNSIFTKILHFLIIQQYLFIVPKMHLLILGLRQIHIATSIEGGTLIINVAFAIFGITEALLAAPAILFKIKPFRKKSIHWNINNYFEFVTYVMGFTRVLIILADGRSVSFLIVSFVAQLFARQSISSGYLTKQSRKLHEFSSNLNISVHIALLVGDFSHNSPLATQILCFLLVLSLINSALSFYSIFNEQRYFPLCNSVIYQYYDFYFHFVQQKIKGNNSSSKGKLSIKKDSQNDKIISVHTLNCQAKSCRLKSVKFSQQTYCEDLQNLCNQMMMRQSQQSVINEIIYELWKFQTGNKYKFRMQSKQLSTINQYIVYYSLNLSRLNETSDAINQQNIKSLKNIFYDKLQNCLFSFSLLYQQIAKTQPKLDTLLYVGDDVKQRTNQLKGMYSELLKHSVINFKTAEVYVQFQNFFLKESNVNEESIDRLRKIQKSKEADHIEQIYLPTLTSYAQTGLIQNMNTQCLSFFRLTRFEMKSKSLGSLIYPQIGSVSQIKEKLKLNNKQKLFTFFKRGQQFVYGSISIKQKYIQNKKFDVATIEKNPYSDFKNVILIKKDSFEIETIFKQQTFIRPNLNLHNHLLLKWRYLYQTYLMQKVQELVYQKIVKVRVEEFQSSLFVMSLEETIHDDYYIINLKFIKDMQKKRNRVSSFMITRQPNNNGREVGNTMMQNNIGNNNKYRKFHFFYDFQEKGDTLCLYGVDNQEFRYNTTLNKTKSLGRLQKDLSNILITNTLLQQNRYSKGIKSYRLFNRQLYNIDLQDKEGYVQMFTGETFNENQNQSSDSSQTDLYLITGIFFIILILAGLVVAYSLLTSSYQDNIKQYYSNAMRIEQMRLQMNRLVSITRDMQDGRYENLTKANVTGVSWQADLLQAYAVLKNLRYQSLLFESTDLTIFYRNINYTGTLNQIIDVMISHIYEMTLGNFSLVQINYFHESYIIDVNNRIQDAKYSLVIKVNDIRGDFQSIKRILLIIGIISIFMFYILLALLMIVLNNTAKKKLNEMMLMSDTEARMNQTMADKLKYAVDMIKKNFDLDLKTIIGPPQTHKKRKKPKQIVIGIQKKVFIAIVMISGFALHVFMYYQLTELMSSTLNKVAQFQSQQQKLIQTYATFTEVVNAIAQFDQYDPVDFYTLRQNYNYLALNRNTFSFDDDTNNYIDLLFYQNSCKYLNDRNIFTNQGVTCSQTLPNYLVSNPFELSMIAYFGRAHYNILDNITQTYGCTGVYSGPFVTSFSALSEKIRIYGLSFIQDGFKQLNLYYTLYSIMGALYIFITIGVIYSLKNMNKEINGLLKFLNYNNRAKISKKTINLDKNQKEAAKLKNGVSLRSIEQQNKNGHQDSFKKDCSSEGSEKNEG